MTKHWITVCMMFWGLTSVAFAQIPLESLQYFFGKEDFLQPTIDGPAKACAGTLQSFSAGNARPTDTLLWRVEGAGELAYDFGTSAAVRMKKPGKVLLTLERRTLWGRGQDTMSVRVEKGPRLYLGPDTMLCQGGTLELVADSGFAYYRWQDGSAGNRHLVKKTGTYYLAVQNEAGCVAKDSIQVLVATPPKPALGPDRYNCEPGGIVLDAGDFKSYRWFNKQTLRTLKVDKPGSYRVEVTDVCGQTGADTVKILPWKAPKLSLGEGSFLCEGDTLLLDATDKFSSYLWQDGSRNPKITVTGGGLYWVQATDSVGCHVRDSLRFEVVACEGPLRMPAAFSPNKDGVNDSFKPKNLQGVKALSLQVFDETGLLVYLSASQKAAWDGTFDKKSCQPGVYSYTYQYVDVEGKRRFESGMVELKR